MAFIFLDSFDHYSGAYSKESKYNPDQETYAGLVYTGSDGVLSSANFDTWCGVAASIGRRGTGGWECAQVYLRGICFRPAGGMSKTTLIAGMAVEFANTIGPGAGLSTEWIQLFSFHETKDYQHVSVRLYGDGIVRVYRNNVGSETLLRESAALTWIGANYYYVEVKAYLDGSAGTVEVRRAGTAIVPNSGTLKTTNDTGGTGICDRFIFMGRIYEVSGGAFQTLSRLHVDDVYVADTSGSENNDFVGDIRIDCTFAESAGTYSEWTPDPSAGSNYEMIAESTANETDAIQSSTPGERDSYVFNALTHTPDSILAVQTTLYARRTDATLREVKTFARLGGSPGSDYDLSADMALTDEWAVHTAISPTSPATAAAWTKDEIDAAEFGVEVVS